MLYLRSILFMLVLISFDTKAQIAINEYTLDQRFVDVDVNASSIYHQITIERSSTVNLPYDIVGAKTFSIVKDDILGADFAKKRPDIKMYKISSIDNPTVSGRLMITPEATYASILTNQGLASLYQNDKGQYVIERDIDLSHQGHATCSHQLEGNLNIDLEQLNTDLANARIDFSNGTFRKRFRLAIVCTGEYYVLNGNSNASVQNEIAAAVMGLNVIYENELSVSFDLLDPVLFANPNTDPFIPDNGAGDTRTTQAAQAVNANFALGSYDVGHVFHKSEEDDGWGSGGIARLGAVCDDGISGGGPAKAAGWSGSFVSGNSFIGLAAHEFGHMFNATHTFNGSGESCDDAISSTSAFEIGSGTTLMSYQGICSEAQNIPGGGVANHYFHVHSLFQMVNYINNQTPCADNIPTTNTPPVPNANSCGGMIQIPRNTPFFLQGNAGDQQMDNLTYCWEQYDEDGPNTNTQGLIGNAAADNSSAPLFRSFPPTSENIRYFPDLVSLANGPTSDPFQALSNRSRVLNFQFTVRDNNPDGGGIASDEVQVEVVNSGPLVLDNVSSLTAGMSTTITWSTNGTEDICSQVKLLLSVDGGVTYPFTMLSGIDYGAGTADLSLPSSFPSTEEGRLMLVCEDSACYGFFDITNGVFSINSDCAAAPSFICDIDYAVFDQGDAALDLDLDNYNGAKVGLFNQQITASDDQLPLIMFNQTETGCFQFPNASNRAVEKRITVDQSGTYTFSIDFDIGNGSKIINIYEANTYEANTPCPSFISSNTTHTGGNGFSLSSVMDAQLEACTEYIVTLYINAIDHPQTFSVPDISGPGEIIEIDETATPDYSATYIAVDEDGEIEVVSPSADFRSLSGGLYDIYTVNYKSGGITPPDIADPSTWPGQLLTAIQSSNCMLISSNKKTILVEFTCRINEIAAGMQTPCDPLTNTYTQEVIVTYESAPLNGMLQVNGVSFPITGSPQTVSLNAQISDGQPVGVSARFTALQSCMLFESNLYTAPENCCGIDFDLGGDRSICDGQPILLDAGADGEEYRWFRNGDLIDAATTSELSVTESGTYLVVVTNATGCSKEETVNIAIFESPSVMLGADRSECEGEFFLLPLMTNASAIQWYKDGTELAGETDLSLLIINAGEYAAIGTTTYALTNGESLSCAQTDTINIAYVARPIVDLGDDIEICEGEPAVMLDAGQDGTEYTWTRNGTIINGETADMLSVETSGQYAVNVDSGGGCDAQDTVNISFVALAEVNAGQDINLCTGSTAQLFSFIEAVSYEWIFEGVLFSDQTENPMVTQGGVYVLLGYNALDCIISDTVIVNEIDPPMIDLGEDRVACIGSEIPLSIDSIGTIIWRKDGANFSTNANVTITEPGEYIVSVIAGSNCNGRDTIMVDFQPGPTLDIGDDQSFCMGGDYTIVATTDGDNITWFRDDVEIIGETDFQLTVTSSGTYQAIVEGLSGCSAEQEITVMVNEVPDLELGDNVAVCDGDPAMIGTSVDADIYEWTFMGSVISSDPTLTVTTPGIYTLLVLNEFGCSDSDDIEVVANATPMVALEDLYAFCEGENVMITANGDGDSFKWIVAGVEVTGETGPTITVAEAGLVEVTASSTAGCTNSAITTVEIGAAPTVALGADEELCPSQSITLNPGNHSQYAWSDGSDGSTLIIVSDVDVLTTEIYAVTVTNTAGCTATDEISVIFYPSINLVIEQSAIGVCDGEPVILSASGGLDYQWIDESGTLSDIDGPTAVAQPTETTTYQLIATDECPGNEATEIVTIEVFSAGDDVTAGEDDCAVNGNSLELSAMGGISYEWIDDGTIISGGNTANPTVSPLEETTYTVNITDANGCIYPDSVFICLLDDPLEFFKLVTIITPNGDGDNDGLRFEGLEAFPDNTISIYNRWGYPVFEKRRYQEDGILWEGESGGDVLPVDTYYYILTFDGNTYKSTITIMR